MLALPEAEQDKAEIEACEKLIDEHLEYAESVNCWVISAKKKLFWH